jgi:hypothetical protein
MLSAEYVILRARSLNAIEVRTDQEPSGFSAEIFSRSQTLAARPHTICVLGEELDRLEPSHAAKTPSSARKREHADPAAL